MIIHPLFTELQKVGNTTQVGTSNIINDVFKLSEVESFYLVSLNPLSITALTNILLSRNL